MSYKRKKPVAIAGNRLCISREKKLRADDVFDFAQNTIVDGNDATGGNQTLCQRNRFVQRHTGAAIDLFV